MGKQSQLHIQTPMLPPLGISKTNALLLNVMDDYVRVLDGAGRILFENEALRQFTQVEGQGHEVFPMSTATSSLLDGSVTTSEFCVAGHVFSLKNSPYLEDGKVKAVVQVFRDTTVQNNITLELLQANRRLQNEIALARSIQTKMLPRLTGYGPLEFHVAYVPTDELSGDFFDLVPLGQGQLGFYISDVVGHGVSASILTMFVRQTMRSILEEEKIREPAKVLGILQDRFTDIHMGDGQYFSMFYAVFNTIEHQLTYANAGHNCIPMVEHDGNIEWLELSGRLISNDQSDYVYRQETRPLREGDRFLFYTDGAVENRNAKGEMYGEENLEKSMLATQGNVVDFIMQDIHQFTIGKLKDDIALVYVENKRRKA